MSSGSVLPSAERLESLLKVGALPLLGAAFLLTLVLGSFLFPLPSFHTDLAEFSPVSDTDAAEARILAEFGDESRLLGVHVKSTSGDGNALSIASLQQQQTDLEALREWASQNGHLIDGSMTAPEIIQRALDEETGDGLSLQDVTSWEQLINETVPEGTQCIDGAADEELVTLAGFAKDALLHRDLVFEETTCAWLDANRSSGDATPFASSTLWVLYINPDLEDEVRQNMVNLLRLQLNQMEAADGSDLEYGVISNDLISHDINQGTLGNLVWLIAGAVAVVVLLLAIAFRSIQGVAFPLVALSMALVWTYGGLAVFQTRFSVLEVAVAPVVLGLGIDYSIHLQRFYNVARDEGQDAAAAVPEIQTRLHDLGVSVPLVGDFHYIGHKLLSAYPACAEALAKYRINPGNVGFREKRDKQFSSMIETALEYGRPVRIGRGPHPTNQWRRGRESNPHGAWPQRILSPPRLPFRHPDKL